MAEFYLKKRTAKRADGFGCTMLRNEAVFPHFFAVPDGWKILLRCTDFVRSDTAHLFYLNRKVS